ncbi:GNAT family N-acetyltransferase [Candidatus Beckwithbacteria bacterium]|nr:GNAT family N-acetyltransferase [Candidatus Beckwithbacteria bacterium]
MEKSKKIKESIFPNILINSIKNTKFLEKDIYNLLVELDQDFFPPLSLRVNLKFWANKLYTKSEIILAFDQKNNQIIALLCFYCNNHKTKYSYIPVLGVRKDYRENGIMKTLFCYCLNYLKKLNFKILGIKTWDNSIPLKMYKSLGFKIINKIQDRPDGRFTFYLEKKI